ncbi:AMP-binding protein [Streptomyces sp. NA04227]|uniref:AMP-binding protein n=1 Tax=Streptomyces sp. NA04227 TaxID=2742136 RepID=UPI0015901E23|nr:AMP-binding protein [Streptomyces sp. NA04227]QKW10457.1 AMP-binding protein [Streptomyces sp. NA04227]
MTLLPAEHRTFRSEEVRGHSIVEGLLRSRPGAGLTVLDGDLAPRRLGCRELAGHAEEAARALRARGVSPGDRVCLLAPTDVATLITLFGAWRLGAAPVVLPRPPRRGTERAVAEIRRRVEAAGAALFVTTDELAPLFTGRLPLPVVSLGELRRSLPPGPPPAMPSPQSIGLVQFTSGTTAASRAVAVTQEQLVGNIAALGERIGFGPDDVYVTWLPLYHDMGMVTLAGFAAGGADVVALATETFRERPGCWLRTISDYGGTFTAAPDFAYSLAARLQSLSPAQLNLSSLRIAANGAEAVDVHTVRHLRKTLAPYGLRENAMCPTYGLAEATLGVTGSAHDEPVRVVEPRDLTGVAGEHRPDRPLVSCGRPLPGTEVRVENAAGEPLPEGAVGEIKVRGPGVVPGYWTAAEGLRAGDPVREGWLATGDLGFLDAGELVVCGRIKDMIIAGGRNLYPEDYEFAAERVSGVREGQVAAFSLPGQERMVVVAESRAADLEGVGRRVIEALGGELDHAPYEVVFIKPGTLPRTSSGKRQRQATRELYRGGGLDVLHTVR